MNEHNVILNISQEETHESYCHAENESFEMLSMKFEYKDTTHDGLQANIMKSIKNRRNRKQFHVNIRGLYFHQDS